MAKRATTQIDELLHQAFKIAIAEVEKRARSVLRAGHKGRNPARSFCMAMGAASFYDKDGEVLASYGQKWKWADPTYDFISLYDEALHLTGYPMKIKGPDEPVLHDW